MFTLYPLLFYFGKKKEFYEDALWRKMEAAEQKVRKRLVQVVHTHKVQWIYILSWTEKAVASSN